MSDLLNRSDAKGGLAATGIDLTVDEGLYKYEPNFGRRAKAPDASVPIHNLFRVGMARELWS